MELTQKELNGIIQEAITKSFSRLIKEYQEERQRSLDDLFFESEKMDKVREWLARGGWELAEMLKKKEETKEVKYFVTPADGVKAKGEWAMMAGRIGEIFGKPVKQGAVKKEVIDPKAKKSKKYDPSADENAEKTGTHWFIITRDDVDWELSKPEWKRK